MPDPKAKPDAPPGKPPDPIVEPIPPEPVLTTSMDVNITVPDGLQVQVTVNGQIISAPITSDDFEEVTIVAEADVVVQVTVNGLPI